MSSRDAGNSLVSAAASAIEAVRRGREGTQAGLIVERDTGRILQVGEGVAFADGLAGVQAEELLRFPHDRRGIAYNLDPGEVGIILLDPPWGMNAGDEVKRTGRVLDVPVGDGLLGRVVDPLGRPLDGSGRIQTGTRLPVEQPAPGIMERAPVEIPLQTGIKVVDALIPVGRGQRELILGDRQTGKTAIATDTIVNQKDHDVLCVYCGIAQRSSAMAKVINELRNRGAMDYTVVVVTNGEDPAGLQFIAPYAAMTIAEHFMSNGRDVLLVFDDLTRHARAYRELSLLLRRPPGREAYPGDIFYIHSRLLERATHLRDHLGGGSVTALPIVETQAQNISAYIPTNLISITDGQIYVSPDLFQQGVLPAVDVGRSVSRVGGKAQLPAYRAVAGDLKLSYAQFQELERFTRYGARLEDERRTTLEHGRRVREIFKQSQYAPLSAGTQVAVLVCVTEGVFDSVPIELVSRVEETRHQRAWDELGDLLRAIEDGQKLTREDRDALRGLGEKVVASLKGDGDHGDA